MPATSENMRDPDDRSPRRRAAGAALLAAGAGAAAAGVVHAMPALCAPVPAMRPLLGVADRTDAEQGYALTFDDGPHPQGTPLVLEILRRYDAPATFFLVGEQVARAPALAAELVAAGHEIALHCHRHRNLLRLGPRQVREDLDRAQHHIGAATGQAPAHYRPPYGVLSATALQEARRRGWRTILWTSWGRDWEERATGESVHALLTREVRPGGVLLLHDADDYGAPGCWRSAVDALPRVIETLGEQGLRPAGL
jgi:peptidoglycan/xylan/chitin deacetylase (PgdA/CDA1 family)